MTRTSVVVVTYQSAGTIAACLRSLPPGLEVVVVDNASDDASAAIAKEGGAAVTVNALNRGFAAAANQGARLTSGQFVLFLNPDAQIVEDCVARLEQALDAHAEVAAVGPASIDSEGKVLPGLWPFPRATHSWVNQLGLHRLLPSRPPRDGFVVGTCLLVRRSWFDRLGGFDEEFWLYGEDADFGRRALNLGGRSMVVEGAAIHHIGGHSADQSEVSFEQFFRGTDLYIKKHHGAASLVSHRVADLIGAVVRTVAFWPTRRVRSRFFGRLARRELRALLRRPTSP